MHLSRDMFFSYLQNATYNMIGFGNIIKPVLKGQKSLGRRCVGLGRDRQIYEVDKGVVGCQQGREEKDFCKNAMTECGLAWQTKPNKKTKRMFLASVPFRYNILGLTAKQNKTHFNLTMNYKSCQNSPPSIMRKWSPLGAKLLAFPLNI